MKKQIENLKYTDIKNKLPLFQRQEGIAMLAVATTSILIGAGIVASRERRIYQNPFFVTLSKELEYAFIPWGDSLMTGKMGDRAVAGGWVLPLVEDINKKTSKKIAFYEPNKVLAISGQTSKELIEKLSQNHYLDTLDCPKIVCISIGGNDLGNALLEIASNNTTHLNLKIYSIMLDARKNFKKNFNNIIAIAHSFHNTQVLVLPIPDLTITPYVNNIINLSYADKHLQNLVKQSLRASLFYFNRCIKRSCDEYKIPYIYMSKHTEELVCTEDGFHPNEKGLEMLALAARQKFTFVK